MGTPALFTRNAIPTGKRGTPPPWLVLIPVSLALLLYLVTCSPTINFGDSGELTTVAWTLGIAYPPGYPLYTLLSSAFIHMPIGAPAWRLNLLSALFAALAIGLFYRLVTETLTQLQAGPNANDPRAIRDRRSTPV